MGVCSCSNRLQRCHSDVCACCGPELAPLTRRSVLDEVRALWEAKLVATGVVGEPSNEGAQ